VAGELRRSLSTFSSLPHALVARGLSVGGWRIAQVSPSLSLSFSLSLSPFSVRQISAC
jgi:hypothetical protein